MFMKIPSTPHQPAIRNSRQFASQTVLMTGAVAILCCLLMASTASAQHVQTIYSFGVQAPPTLTVPTASLIPDKAGNLYSIASNGGDAVNGQGAGGIFELSPPATKGGVWKYTPIYLFSSQSTGYHPIGDMVMDANGALYGVTQAGGVGGSGNGVVYQLVPPAVRGGAWTENVLYAFTAGDDGAQPDAGLAFDKTGNLYGTTSTGGSLGGGVVFELSPPAVSGGAWTFNVLFSFDATSDSPGGCSPFGTLLPNFSGGLFGTTSDCGANGGGVAFELTPPANGQGAWTETVLHSFVYFTDSADGSGPFARLTPGTKGVLFGTTEGGGTTGAGVVYELVPPATKGGAWTENVLYNFESSSGGIYPSGGVTLTSGGALYGCLLFGTTSDGGVVYKLAPPAVSGDPWTETPLVVFSGTVIPEGTPLFSGGAIFATTFKGGTNGTGSVFKLNP